MGIVWIIILLVCVGLIVAALFSQISWRQALIYLAAVGIIALALFLILPRIG